MNKTTIKLKLEANLRTQRDAIEQRESYDFFEYILEAYEGRRKPLCKYLLSDLPLGPRHREELAKLIERRLRRDRKRLPNETREMERAVAFTVCKRLKNEKARSGRRSIRRGRTEELLDEALGEMAEDGELFLLTDEELGLYKEALERRKQDPVQVADLKLTRKQLQHLSLSALLKQGVIPSGVPVRRKVILADIRRGD